MMAGDAMALVEASLEAEAGWDADADPRLAGPMDWLAWLTALAFCGYLMG